jgi:hypothetical protein
MRRAGVTPNRAGSERQTERERGHSPVDMCVIEARDSMRCQCHQSAATPCGQRQSDHSGANRKQHAFGQQLPDDSPSARTQRRPQCNLSRAGRTARQQQIGHIGAGDQQYQKHGTEQYR